MEAKQKRQTSKNTWTPIHTHEQPWTSMDAHEHSSAHEHPWTHMNSCFSKYNAAGKLLVEPSVSQFLSSYFGLLAMRVFDLIVFFLNWTLFIFLCVMFFCFVLWWLRAPKKSLPIFAKHDFWLIYMYIVIHLFIQIYIYICNVTYFYIQYNKYVYIYVCLCVCGGAASKWGVLFSSQRTLFGTKKGQTYPCIYNINIYIYWQVFFVLSCVGLSHPKYMFSGFLLYVVFQHHFIGKNVSNQKVFHWRLQYR